MPNLENAAKCICPYYLSEGEKSICCEGVISGTRTLSRFASTQEREQHQRSACQSYQYAKMCSVARMLDIRYWAQRVAGK